MMEKTMRDRLEKIQARDEEITEMMMSSEVLSDRKMMAKLGKEQSSMQQVLHAYRQFLEAEDFFTQAQEMLAVDEPELQELAAMESAEYSEKMVKIIEELEVLLVPKDPSDSFDAIVEIRGAAGGDEGNIFAGDLYRMYTRYAESLGYKYELIEAMDAEAGGYSLISFVVKGAEPFRHFKFESGAHRVQRVPKTETQGRIHTSTATVLVLADVEDEEIDIDPNDLEIDTMRSSGAGGQHVNKTDSFVRIVHKPTGIAVKCQDGRSQHDNKDKAMRLVRARVYEEHQRRIQEERHGERQSKVGTGARSEKIRTYNYPQNRVSDHRIGLTLQKLDIIMEGKLDEIVNALLEQEQKEILEQGA
ncbi:peptide chain release factor 1 [Erysipelothrix rhusiopathiae]|uniref:peptide chain release factor 1 n=1 Tax=Erysipelothrix rhusiopathiae TaxID=1648 RepID=UPI002B256586|nr:peptide chain release factor 1 [Erysipelothrix rhusiopathiae]WRB93318.1 peptide chain release factor 1 [Erysipelothrix rhusiopathiae]